jgi:carbon-monoxide dehydrogenase catalytic subunit
MKGVAAIVGCNNPRVTHDEAIHYITRELIKNNVLVVTTGCSAIASGKYGLLTPEMMEEAGPGLREVCEAVGIPPVLHLGSCVDNSRILTILTEIVEEGGLGEDISEIPAVGICPEWMSEKALAIACYAVASGVYVIFGGVGAPYSASSEVVRLTTEGWEKQVSGKLEFVTDYREIVPKALDHINKKREALGIHVEKERILYDMAMRRELSV